MIRWVAGQWSRCSVTCGNGTRTRELKCMQELNGTTQQVSSHNCPADPKITIPLIEACYMPDCNIYMTSKPKQLARWEVGNWSPVNGYDFFINCITLFLKIIVCETKIL